MKNPYQAAMKNSLSTSSAQEVEAWALIELAGRLDRAAKSGDKEQLLETMRLNWRVWTIFHAELANPDHAMKNDVRENMLSLCRYVDKRCVEIIRDPRPELLEVLITINRHIGNGLLGRAAGDDGSDESTASPPNTHPVDAPSYSAEPIAEHLSLVEPSLA